MRDLLVFLARQTLATIGSLIVCAFMWIVLMPGLYADWTGLIFVPLIPVYGVIVLSSGVEDALHAKSSRQARLPRTLRMAMLYFVASFITLSIFGLLLARGAFRDWIPFLWVSVVFSIAITIWGLSYWLIFRLTSFLAPASDQ
jgi:cytochrome c biogenesis protein CcdA